MKLKSSGLYFLSFLIFWMVFFLVFRVVFLVYHQSIYSEFSLADQLATVWHGLYMDLSMAAYFCLFPCLMWLVKDLISTNSWVRWLTYYQLILMLLVSWFLMVDLEIFHNWGHRLDSAILPYLKFPKEAIASSSSSPIRILFTIFGLGFVVPSMIWAGVHVPLLRNLGPKNGHFRWLSLVAIPLLIVLMRGGFQLAPMNQSSVYFSNHRLLNQAAENGIWVFVQSVLQQSDENFQALYAPFPAVDAEKATLDFFPKYQPSDSSILTVQRPNIVLIVWESLTAKVVGHLNGAYPSTAHLDQMAKNGVFFTNLYANGDRSDKGLASLLSAVPALGKLSIMFEPNRTAKLEFLPTILKEEGYSTAYLYGGDLGFANMKSYMFQAGFETLIGDADFPKSMQNSKWGAHDEAVFDRQIQVADQSKTPFFHTLFTLSSHEPFEVPGVQNTGNEPIDTLFCRSHRYTDRCLGNWLKQAQGKEWWKNTLVIVVADHGHAQPAQSPEASPEKYHIPMVWFGPVVKPKGQSITGFGNQTDVSRSLLDQMKIEKGELPFSRNLFAPNSYSAIYAFRSGFGEMGPDGNTLLIDGESTNEKQKNLSLIRQQVFTRYFQAGEK